ncbi:type I-C CRISPR-associated protein Cas8c/Csd1 [Fundicoccus culcitae]|uniref:Type I-C CRISPR-associated protein Cas8c/Csd1 n=1 Tax=Fundicoccus culcitae TaxID=2969821 RepID=A0ABY5P242_9LACT|nr:type I-C CRISPR-associated protein Cas8c/Csd1 [Fundicoccus culcitae]UUX32772.1 type I-C CRISPR-associated protein Cas8c/Csd1 [Fundicoccus culcitae]
MNLWESLLTTYEKIEKAGKVGQKLEHSTTRLLPIYHNDRVVTDSDNVIEIVMDESSNFITVSKLDQNSYIIFPVTLDSVSRSGVNAPPHPLQDDLQYLTTEFDEKKYAAYIKQLKEWVEVSNVKELKIIYNYMLKNSIISDISSYLDKKIIAKKTFVTFSIKKPDSFWTPTNSSELHEDYIDYVKSSLSEEEQGICSITGKKMYLSDKHRGLLGTAKLISVSNNKETYSGRISDKSKVSFLGYETSEKIFLMLRYLLSQRSYSRSIGDATYLVTWDATLEAENIDLTKQVNEEDFDSRFAQYSMPKENKNEAPEDILNPILSTERIKHLSGYKAVNKDSDYFVLIINKISNGRISIKYFRNFSGSELSDRILNWYQTTNWPVWTKEGSKHITLGLNNLVQRIIGTETKDKKIVSRNEALNRWYIEKLLMSILEGNRLPLDLVTVVRSNITHRERYSNTWQQMELASLSLIKKYHADYLIKISEKEVSPVLENNSDRSYLFGRLMAIAENIEQLSMGEFTRTTLVSKYWHQLCVRPQSAFNQVKSRLLPYERRLQKSKPKAFLNRDRLIQDIYSQLDLNDEYLLNPDKPLSELFLVGYYAQKNALSSNLKTTKNENEEETVQDGITE